MPGLLRVAGARLLVSRDLPGGELTELVFTSEQLRAIERRDGSLFLHAGAGTGKTAVLVERFVQAVLSDGAPVDGILAITFTEKAAGELKTKIRERFVGLGERERAREAEGAWISTIHGFCSRVLRFHPIAAGIDPDYRVLDEAEAARLGRDAFERALEEFVRESPDPGRLELVARYTPDKLGDMVRTAYSHLRSRGERHPRLPEREPPRTGDEREELGAAVAVAQAELGSGSATGPAVEGALERLERCREEVEAGLDDPTRLEKLVVKGTAGALKTPAFERLAEAHQAYLRACVERQEHADYTLLRDLLVRHDARYQDLKDARSGLDFEDLELAARDLLREHPGIGDRYRRRFAHVMVDEFQDTNRLQVELLELVSDGNLFTVGDEHQSIYGFRNADIGLFRERAAAAEAEGRVERLSVSFRARPELLDAIDLAFGRAFEDGHSPLRPAEDAVREGGVHVDLLVVDGNKGRWEATVGEDAPFGPSLASYPAWRAAEARLLALRIDELVGEDGPFECGDVAVLLRATTDVAAYERALEERGIPTYVAGGRGYWGQQQVADLRAYLAALANPLDELSLLSVLGSPMVGASLDSLAIVGLRAKDLGRDSWWALEEAFCGGDGSDGLAGALPDPDRDRIAAFVRRFADERRAAPRLSLETLIDRAVTDSGYDLAILSLPSGARRMANVRKLMRMAREFEAEEGRDLRGFIDYVAERDVAERREGEAPLEPEGLEAVRLMSIHAAKGLEFPVVCLADLGRTARDDPGALRMTDDGRVGLRLASMGGGKVGGATLEQIKQEQREAQEREERRVTYVAVTRAQRHLVLSGAADVAKWPAPRPLGAPIDWVWRAFAPGFPDGLDSYEGREVRVRCVLCSPETVDDVLPQRVPARERTEAPATLPLAPALAAPAPVPALPVSRLSYSGLEDYNRCGYRFYLERVLGMPPALASPVAAPDADELPALLRGTIVHELLERIDFAAPVEPAPEAIAERIAAHAADVRKEDVADVAGLFRTFARSDLRERVAAAERVRTELPFVFTLSIAAGGRSLLVNGFMDVHALEPDGALVVDYKSDRLEGADPAALCEDKYATQRLVYALAALRGGAGRVEVVHCFLERADEPVSATFSADDVPGLERELLALAAGVIGAEFAPTDDPHRELCATCAGQPGLCSWGPERTLADPPPAPTAAPRLG